MFSEPKSWRSVRAPKVSNAIKLASVVGSKSSMAISRRFRMSRAPCIFHWYRPPTAEDKIKPVPRSSR